MVKVKKQENVVYVVKQAVSEVIDEKHLATRNDLGGLERRTDIKLDEKLSKEDFETTFTKFKSDFFTKIDPILKEVTASREERITRSAQHLRNEKRIEKLEKIHPHSKHAATI